MGITLNRKFDTDGRMAVKHFELANVVKATTESGIAFELPAKGVAIRQISIACLSTDFTFRIYQVAGETVDSVHNVIEMLNENKHGIVSGDPIGFCRRFPEDAVGQLAYMEIVNTDAAIDTGTIKVEIWFEKVLVN